MPSTVKEPDARTAVLHIGLDPRMGVWSALRTLADGQRVSGRYAAVACGVIADDTWPSLYRAELEATGEPRFFHRAPRLFGTAQALALVIQKPDLAGWVAQLRRVSGARRVVVHLHAGWRAGGFLPRSGLASPDTVVVSTFHGINPILARQPVRRHLHAWMATRLTRTAVHLTSVDHANLARYEALLGLSAARFRVIPNGLPDTSRRGCPSLAGRTPFTVGYVGSIIGDKGWRVAADAVERLLQRGVAVRLILAGSGPEDAEAHALAARYPGKIEHRGQVANAREAVMPELDLLTLMSCYEGFPMTVMEAMSLGIPVAATAVGDIPRQIEDGRSGFLLPRDPGALADVILSLSRDAQRLRTLGMHARGRFETRFMIDDVVRRYDALYAGRPDPHPDAVHGVDVSEAGTGRA
ncbi:MAG: glycosyltransferase family 4 protein [Lentisphaerae bacterium]|nr:glycosyltransferase family 4 protein [Lentisphaerota bacterium]